MFLESKIIKYINASNVNNFFIISIILFKIRREFQFFYFQLIVDVIISSISFKKNFKPLFRIYPLFGCKNGCKI